VAQARTPVRLWVIPNAAELPSLMAGSGHRGAGVVPGRTAPAAGVHPTGTYPPLAVPPGPPDGTEDPQVDRRFERRMWWLVLLALLVALLLTAANLLPGPAWAEMRTDRALLTADRGRMTVLLDGATVTLESGERRYVDAGTRIDVADRSTGSLVFHGGSAAVLCPGSRTEVLRLHTVTGRDRDPQAALAIGAGRLLADTTSVSGAYRPLSLVVQGPLGDVRNAGAAWYSVEGGGVTVSTGQVTVAGRPIAPTRADLTCGDGVPVTPPAAGPSETPSLEPPSELPSLLPSTSSPTPAQTPPPVVRQPPNNPPATTRTTTRPPTSRPSSSPPPTTSPTPTQATSSPVPPSPTSSPPSPSESSSTPPVG
jgi:putative peptide zinc metalloprotease protein